MKKVGSKMKTGIDRIFDKTLQDLVRGVRNAKGHEREYVLEAVEEIREELKNPKSDVKSVAISKLCFLHMLGYEMGWASFNIIEVMSSTKERFFANYDILLNILFNNLYYICETWMVANRKTSWLLGGLSVIQREHRCAHAIDEFDQKRHSKGL